METVHLTGLLWTALNNPLYYEVTMLARISLPPSLSLCPYHSSLPAGLPNYILCWHRVEVNKFLPISKHWHIHVKRSIGEGRLWALNDDKGFCFKKLTSIHDRLAIEMNICLEEADIPERMTKGKTTLIQKDLHKGTAQNNYRPITCLSTTWKILRAQIREKILYLLTSRGLFPEELKEYRNGIRGTGGRL